MTGDLPEGLARYIAALGTPGLSETDDDDGQPSDPDEDLYPDVEPVTGTAQIVGHPGDRPEQEHAAPHPRVRGQVVTSSHAPQTTPTTANSALNVRGSTVVPPVGAVVTSTQLTFSIAPANPAAIPVRLRCTSCEWQATATGPDEIREQTDRHALAHEINPEPWIEHLPSWLQWRKGNL